MSGGDRIDLKKVAIWSTLILVGALQMRARVAKLKPSSVGLSLLSEKNPNDEVKNKQKAVTMQYVTT